MVDEQPAIPRFEDTGLTRTDLEEAADELGVEHDGVGDQRLLERLGVELGELDADQVDDGPEEQPAPGEPIQGPTRDELREELRQRGLPISGTKAELAQRLADDDAS
jgi:hypothetical protein